MRALLELLVKIFAASVKKHGDKPLTTLHMLNILKMALRAVKMKEFEQMKMEEAEEEMLNEILEDEKRYGSY
jgi:hypothetical protein